MLGFAVATLAVIAVGVFLFSRCDECLRLVAPWRLTSHMSMAVGSVDHYCPACERVRREQRRGMRRLPASVVAELTILLNEVIRLREQVTTLQGANNREVEGALGPLVAWVEAQGSIGAPYSSPLLDAAHAAMRRPNDRG